MTAKNLKTTNIALDFKSLKSSFKEFLKNQDTFKDFNFDTAGLDVILDILAYNSQMNAMTAHLVMNELFLDSAQTRSSVVSLAKQLGYSPASSKGAIARCNLTLTPITAKKPDVLSIDSSTKFTSPGNLTWYPTKSQSVSISSSGIYSFSDVYLRQGVLKQFRYYYDSRFPYRKYEIPDIDVDVDSISVTIIPNLNDSSEEINCVKFNTFNDIIDGSPIFFVQENPLGRYDIYFPEKGDIGNYLVNGSIIEISYLVTVGSVGNSVSQFSYYGENRRYYASRITVLEAASGGHQKESTNSIRHNAPQFFKAQDRCVTESDYATVIKNKYPRIESIAVWGGEKESPPEYGKVFICCKPYNGLFLSNEEKNTINNEIIIPKSMLTVDTVFVDPDITYLSLGIDCRIDSTEKKATESEIKSDIKESIARYYENNLTGFESIFRYSKLLHAIDFSNTAIKNTLVNLVMFKKLDFSTVNAADSNYEFIFTYPGELVQGFAKKTDNADAETPYYITSSFFFINRVKCYIRDASIVTNTGSSTSTKLELISVNDLGEEVRLASDVGYLDKEKHTIKVSGIKPDSAYSIIRLYMKPKSNDIIANKRQLIAFDFDSPDDMKITLRGDTMDFDYPNSQTYERFL